MNTTPLLKHLEALTLAQATERARRIQDHARRKNGGSLLAVRVLAVTPCGDEEPDTEVVAECEEWQEAIGRGAAHIFARSRFDTAEALVLVAEGRSRTDEDDPSPSEVALAVAVTLGPCPRYAFSAVNAVTLERHDLGGAVGSPESPLVALLEQVALSAEVLRGARRSLGVDADG